MYIRIQGKNQAQTLQLLHPISREDISHEFLEKEGAVIEQVWTDHRVELYPFYIIQNHEGEFVTSQENFLYWWKLIEKEQKLISRIDKLSDLFTSEMVEDAVGVLFSIGIEGRAEQMHLKLNKFFGTYLSHAKRNKIYLSDQIIMVLQHWP